MVDCSGAGASFNNSLAHDVPTKWNDLPHDLLPFLHPSNQY